MLGGWKAAGIAALVGLIACGGLYVWQARTQGKLDRAEATLTQRNAEISGLKSQNITLQAAAKNAKAVYDFGVDINSLGSGTAAALAAGSDVSNRKTAEDRIYVAQVKDGALSDAGLASFVGMCRSAQRIAALYPRDDNSDAVSNVRNSGSCDDLAKRARLPTQRDLGDIALDFARYAEAATRQLIAVKTYQAEYNARLRALNAVTVGP